MFSLSLSPKIRRSHDKKSVLMIFNTMSFDTGGPGSLRALSICTSQESVWVQTVYGCKKKKTEKFTIKSGFQFIHKQ